MIVHLVEKEKRSKEMKFKMTREEKNWVLYDVGNSAFVLLVSTIMPIYFNYLAENAGISSVSTLHIGDMLHRLQLRLLHS